MPQKRESPGRKPSPAIFTPGSARTRISFNPASRLPALGRGSPAGRASRPRPEPPPSPARPCSRADLPGSPGRRDAHPPRSPRPPEARYRLSKLRRNILPRARAPHAHAPRTRTPDGAEPAPDVATATRRPPRPPPELPRRRAARPAHPLRCRGDGVSPVGGACTGGRGETTATPTRACSSSQGVNSENRARSRQVQSRTGGGPQA